MDHGRCVHLGDDCRTADSVAGAELGAVVDINRSKAALKIGTVLLDDRAGGIGPFLPKLRQTDLLHRPYPYRA